MSSAHLVVSHVYDVSTVVTLLSSVFLFHFVTSQMTLFIPPSFCDSIDNVQQTSPLSTMYSWRRKNDMTSVEDKSGRVLMSFTNIGMSSYFYAPRPKWRGPHYEKEPEEFYRNRMTWLRVSWLQTDDLLRELDHTRKLIKEYDFLPQDDDVDGVIDDASHVSSKGPLPYWLYIRESALHSISIGLSMYQTSIELETAFYEQTRLEASTDCILDDLQKDITALRSRIVTLELENASREMNAYNGSPFPYE